MLFIIEITESAILEIRVDCLMQKQTVQAATARMGGPRQATSSCSFFLLLMFNERVQHRQDLFLKETFHMDGEPENTPL